MVKNKKSISGIGFFILFNLMLSSHSFADHDGALEWPQKLSQLKSDWTIQLTSFHFESASIDKINALVDWAVRDTAFHPSHGSENLIWFRQSLRRGFSYLLRGKWVSEDPRVSLEESINSRAEEVIRSAANLSSGPSPITPPDLGDPWAPPGGTVSVAGAFVFYRNGSWPPRPVPTYPPYYPSPTRRSFEFTGTVGSVYSQCIRYIDEHRIEYIIAVRANRVWKGNSNPGCENYDFNCAPSLISSQEACRFISASF
jgi:hypothetical protein